MGRSGSLRLSLAIAVGAIATSAAAQTARVDVKPEIGSEATVAPGEAVYSFSRVYTIPGAKTDVDGKAGGLWGVGNQSYPAGTALIGVTSKVKFKACVSAPGTFDASGQCFLDDNGDGVFERTAIDQTTIATKLKTPIPYHLSDVEVRREDTLRRVILYQGATGDSLKFSYREFNFDLARPAFTEEISVPREQLPAMVRVKNAQIEVLAVTGMGLRYRMVRLAE